MSPWLLLLACSGGPEIIGDVAIGVSVDTRLVALPGGSAALEVLVVAPSDTRWTLDPPEVNGLTFSDPDERVERAGDRTVTTRHYPLKGNPGPYVIEDVCARLDNAEPSCARALYIDLGPPKERPGLADIVEPTALWPLWPLYAAACALFALISVIFGVLWARNHPAPLPPVPVDVEPPHLAALRRWETIRGDPQLDDHGKALGLSEVFRAYAEVVLQFPARAWTSSQTLAHLETLSFLPRENLPRARRLLRATDRVKYAEQRPNQDFFDELDSDLRAFIESTRPRTWEGP